MPDEQMVSFLLEFEDQASGALADAQQVFDLASAAFEKGIDMAVSTLDSFESGFAQVGEMLDRGAARFGAGASNATAFAKSVQEAAAAVEEFHSTSEFVSELPEEGFRLKLQDEDFIKGGEKFHEGFEKRMERSRFDKELEDAVRQGMALGGRDQLSAERKSEFLSGAPDQKKGGGGLDIGKSFEKVLTPFRRFINALKGFVIFAAILNAVMSVFQPFIDIMLDFLDAVFAPFSNFLGLIAKELEPVMDELARTIFKAAQPAFESIMEVLKSDVIPALFDLIEAAKPWINWMKDMVISAAKWVSEMLKTEEGISTLKTAILAIIAVALFPLVAGFALVTKAFLALTVALLTNPLTWIIAGILLIVWVLKEWAGGWENLWAITKYVFSSMVEFLGPIWEWIKSSATLLWESLKWVWENGLTGLWSLWTEWLNPVSWISKIGEALSGVAESVKSWFSGIGKTFFEGGFSLIDTMYKGLQKAVQSIPIVGSVAKLAGKIRGYFTSSDAKEGPLSDISTSGEQLVRTFSGGIEKATPQATRSLDSFQQDMEQGWVTRIGSQGALALKAQAATASGLQMAPEPLESPPLTPEEMQAPVVEALHMVVAEVRRLAAEFGTRESEGRVRRELGRLSSFER